MLKEWLKEPDVTSRGGWTLPSYQRISIRYGAGCHVGFFCLQFHRALAGSVLDVISFAEETELIQVVKLMLCL